MYTRICIPVVSWSYPIPFPDTQLFDTRPTAPPHNLCQSNFHFKSGLHRKLGCVFLLQQRGCGFVRQHNRFSFELYDVPSSLCVHFGCLPRFQWNADSLIITILQIKRSINTNSNIKGKEEYLVSSRYMLLYTIMSCNKWNLECFLAAG